MKKIIISFITLCLVGGCGCVTNKASDAVRSYLNKYNTENETVMTELDNLIKENNFSEEESNNYKEIMKKQYKDLSYKIVEEKYNGDEATVSTKITVYDLYNIQKDADTYKNEHPKEFIDEDGNYDANKFLKYKLEQMKKETKQVEYTIDFKVTKKNGEWVIENVSNEDLEKIHGIYNYTND